MHFILKSFSQYFFSSDNTYNYLNVQFSIDTALETVGLESEAIEECVVCNGW